MVTAMRAIVPVLAAVLAACAGNAVAPRGPESRPWLTSSPTSKVIDGHRVAGVAKIVLPEDILRALQKSKPTKLTIETKVCIDRGGDLGEVSVVNPSEDAAVKKAAEYVTDVIKVTWRYSPFTRDGKPIRACIHVIFNYVFHR